MTSRARYATSDKAFLGFERRIRQCIDPTVRLPEWPFRENRGFAFIYEHDRVLGGDFGEVLGALTETYGDSVVTAVCFEPSMAYYRDAYGLYPGFEVDGGAVARSYASAIAYEPGGDPTGALAYTADVIGIIGSTHSWAVWSQRDWEIGLLLVADESGPWLQQDAPAFDRDVDLDLIRSPAGWGVPLSEIDLATFRRNLREWGSGL